MIANIFPGQGAQKVGMGADLFTDFLTISDIASNVLGYDLKELCDKNPEKRLSNTKYTQPALFTVCAMEWIKHYETTNSEPDFLAGHSLGEYTALFAAGVFDFKTALSLVALRGSLMSEVGSGAMAAVIGDDLSLLYEVIDAYEDVFLANANTDTQVVISGSETEIKKITEELQKNKLRVVPLVVSGAFHSRFMKSAANKFSNELEKVKLSAPRIPVVANTAAELYPNESDQIKKVLCSQIYSQVKWADSMRYLRAKGVIQFEEFGPGKTLTNMLESIA